MKSISSLVDAVLKRHSFDFSNIRDDITSNLEFRLFFNIDFSKTFKEAKKEFQRSYFNDVLTLSLGNITLAAKKSNLNRRHLHRIINDLELDPEVHKREMIKPIQYMKNNVYQILEDTVSKLPEKNMREACSQLEEISAVIAKNLQNYSYDEALELFEREFILYKLKEFNFDLKKTAKSMDMSERNLYRKLSKLNIQNTE